MLNELTALLAENRKLKEELKQEKDTSLAFARMIGAQEKQLKDLKQIKAQESICRDDTETEGV